MCELELVGMQHQALFRQVGQAIFLRFVKRIIQGVEQDLMVNKSEVRTDLMRVATKGKSCN